MTRRYDTRLGCCCFRRETSITGRIRALYSRQRDDDARRCRSIVPRERERERHSGHAPRRHTSATASRLRRLSGDALRNAARLETVRRKERLWLLLLLLLARICRGTIKRARARARLAAFVVSITALDEARRGNVPKTRDKNLTESSRRRAHFPQCTGIDFGTSILAASFRRRETGASLLENRARPCPRYRIVRSLEMPARKSFPD